MGGLEQQSVLIVDDDRVSRTMLAELLNPDTRVVLAKDGASALQRIHDDASICLVLLDVGMPGMSGYEVLQKLNSSPPAQDVRVIFISGATEERDEEKGLLLGAVDYVFKPIRPAIVKVRIQNHLRLIAQRKALERLAGHDALTGIANRRSFDEALVLGCQTAVRRQEPVSLAMIDIDFFKQYNDHYGHPAGDEALRRVAQVVASFARRPYDLAARYGGEEFALLLPVVPDMNDLLDRLCLDVVAQAIPHAGSKVAPVVSISVGAVQLRPGATHTPQGMLEHADALLYQAKQQGRNRAVWGPYPVSD
ncbi:GGDEF domain-containing response regulator [Variovorax sp. HJSM1_2]|uniref:GGDEF domain-containing response regulator n=1 Tax=Variovorax sp. HJSM1_2 TaxID=3366263 RepID=UPI003BEB75CA